jgi:hypothetical protein
MTAKLMAPPLMLIVFSLVGLAVPAGVLQEAQAQPVIDEDTLTQEIIEETEQEIEQEAEQEAEQDQDQTQSNEQSAEQSNEADVSQDESNEQANAIVTGDNTASTTQLGENDAVDNEVEAESEGGEPGDASAEEDSEASSTGGESGNAEAELEQEVENTATTIQDSSADNNVLSNENTFGDDVAIVDQDNVANQDAANIGIQEQDLTQTIDQVQDAANLNVDFDVQVGIQQPPPPPPTQPPGPAEPPAPEPAEPEPPAPEPAEPQCPSGFTFNPDTGQCEQFQTASPSCPSGFTFNPDTDRCEQIETAGPPQCPLDFTFNPDTDQCEGPGGVTAPAGQFCPLSHPNYNPETNQCYLVVATESPDCPPDFRYNPATNQCERTETRPPS